MPVLPDYHADDDPPLIITGSDKSEIDRPLEDFKKKMCLIGLLVAFFIGALFYVGFVGTTTLPAQELNSTDRTMPVDQVVRDE